MGFLQAHGATAVRIHALEDGRPRQLVVGDVLAVRVRVRLVDVDPGGAVSASRSLRSSRPLRADRTLRTGVALQIDRFPSLATRARARRARSSDTRFTLYGWGDVDRTGILTGRLARARMRPRPGKARRVWGSGFDVRRQVAAGALRSRARAYPGACAGDSGGPLVVSVRHRPVLLGVTSFGAGRCGARSPTILTSVSHYRRWIISEARALREADATPTPEVGGA